MIGFRVAIAATFTAEPLLEPLQFLFDLLHWKVDVTFAAYSQVFQTLLNAAGPFSGSARDVNIVLLRGDDLPTPELVQELVRAIRASSVSHAPSLFIGVLPAAPAASFDPLIEATLRSELSTGSRVSILSSEEQDRLYPVIEVHDPKAHRLGAIPYTDEYFAALAACLARSMHRQIAAPYKVIALDCDDTLWSGICGEDGPQAVTFDPSRLALQQFMATQRDAGRLLSIVSKNNVEDVAETFRVHPEMPLQLNHFAGTRINWDNKAVSLQGLAQEFNLAMDSFVFIDDNPKEIAEVSAELPQLSAIALPADPDRIPQFLEHIWALDAPQSVTAEDRGRSASYAQQSERASWENQAHSLEEFIAGLELNVEITLVVEAEIPRVAQLTQRTNQMNLSTRRRSEAEIREFLAKDTGFSVRAKDRFGDYGLVGVVLLESDGGELTLDTFLLSCRALGRGVEQRMLRRVGEFATEHRFDSVTVNFESTPRNAPARDLLSALIGLLDAPLRLAARELAGVVYDPARKLPHSPTSAQNEANYPQRRPPNYQRIAEVHSPSRMLAAMHDDRQRTSVVRPVSEEPRTELETELAAIWIELLGVSAIGIHENFFDLGGHSLLAVQLVSRLYKELAIDLPLEAVYTGTLTIAELARSIELFQLGGSDGDAYAALLAEIENLSDEEAEALLRRESLPHTPGVSKANVEPQP